VPRNRPCGSTLLIGTGIGQVIDSTFAAPLRFGAQKENRCGGKIGRKALADLAARQTLVTTAEKPEVVE
jgi:hypothetical protein